MAEAKEPQRGVRASRSKAGIKAGAKSPAAPPVAPNPSPSMNPPAGMTEELRKQIEEAAYYRAQQRGFAPGYELEDWIAAEADVMKRNGVR